MRLFAAILFRYSKRAIVSSYEVVENQRIVDLPLNALAFTPPESDLRFSIGISEVKSETVFVSCFSTGLDAAVTARPRRRTRPRRLRGHYGQPSNRDP